MSTDRVYRRLARAQGVERPYDILVRMHPANRRLVADLLGCKNVRSLDPHAQAWRVINRSLWGLQARTHTIPEQLTPFSRNNNWWEIVTRTARRLGVSFYPGVGEQEVERLVFERFAAGFAQAQVSGEFSDVDSLVDDHPEVGQAMTSLRLSPAASRSVLSALALAQHRRVGERGGCKNLGDWLLAGLRWSWTYSIAVLLRVMQEKMTDIYSSWASSCRGGFSKVSAVIALIYFQDLVDRTLEDYS